MKISLGGYIFCICLCSVDLCKTENIICRVAIRNETNNTLTDAKLHAPLCYPCNNGTTSNESYCFIIDDSSIGCFVETGINESLDLYQRFDIDTFINIFDSLPFQ